MSDKPLLSEEIRKKIRDHLEKPIILSDVVFVNTRTFAEWNKDALTLILQALLEL